MRRLSGVKSHLQGRNHYLWEIEWQLSKINDRLISQMVSSRALEDHEKSLSPREAQPSIRKTRTMKKCHTRKGGEFNPWGLSHRNQHFGVTGEGNVGMAEEDVDNALLLLGAFGTQNDFSFLVPRVAFRGPHDSFHLILLDFYSSLSLRVYGIRGLKARLQGHMISVVSYLA